MRTKNHSARDFGGQLSDGGEGLNLRKPDLSIVDTVNYDDVAPWPTAADGTGAALQHGSVFVVGECLARTP